MRLVAPSRGPARKGASGRPSPQPNSCVRCGSHLITISLTRRCSCSNGTEACDVGQSCFWFSSGCTIGCEKCDGNGGRPGDGTMHGVGACRCPGHCINSTNNAPGESCMLLRPSSRRSLCRLRPFSPRSLSDPSVHTAFAGRRTPVGQPCGRCRLKG